jgi:hypothetical protein
VRIPKSAMPQPKTIHVKAVANGKTGGQVTTGRGEDRQNVPAVKARAGK